VLLIYLAGAASRPVSASYKSTTGKKESSMSQVVCDHSLFARKMNGSLQLKKIKQSEINL